MNARFFILAAALGVITLIPACAPVIVAGGATAAVATTNRRSVGTQLDDENIELTARRKINRSVGTQLDDENIELTARRKINDDNRLGDDVHINITCFNGTLLLTGEATTAGQRDIVVSLVRTLQGVKRIINEISIAEPRAFAYTTNDGWITGKVKAKLLGTEGLPSNQIKVVTENSVVYLMGLVTQKEGELAAEATRTVGGINRVVKLFEYLD